MKPLLAIFATIAALTVLAIVTLIAVGALFASQMPAAAAPTSARESTAIPQPTGTPVPPTPAPSLAAIGETASGGGVALTVNAVSTVAEDAFGPPQAGSVYFVVDVTLENLSRNDGAAYSPFYFTVQDADGFEYAFETYIDPAIRAATLPLGERVRGNVTFEVPAAATGLILSFEPAVIGGDYERLRAALGDLP